MARFFGISSGFRRGGFRTRPYFFGISTARLWRRAGIAALIAGCFTCAEAQQADLLLVNGRVFSYTWPDPAGDGSPAAGAPYVGGVLQPDADAIAIRDGKILAVGSRRELERYANESTRVLDVYGATVLPGLVDSHTHLAGLGARLERVDLTGVQTEKEAVERIVQRAKQVSPGEWIIGQGWDEGAWATRYPDKRLLSARVPEHPVVLLSLHGFAVWCNQMALDRAGITASTPQPQGGEIRKDARGEPAGLFLNRATALITGALPEPTPAQRRERIRRGLEEMVRSGYVAIHDAGIDRPTLQAFMALHAEGELPLRAYLMLNDRDTALLEEWRQRGPYRSSDSKLFVRAVKAHYDGALGSRGARLLEPYADQPGYYGVSGAEYGFDQTLIAEMMAGGFQVAVHAIGDAANRETLAFFARAFAKHPEGRQGRHRIEHAQIVHPDDFARFRELGIIASMQPPHAVEDKAWAEARLGPERVKFAYAWRTFRHNGVRLIFNSDLSGSDHNIFYGLHAAITRRDKSLQPPGGWYPEQCVTPEEAVRAYTVWPAHAAFLEQETGTLAPGKWADLTVIDIDPHAFATGAPDRLLEGRIVATLIAGRVAYLNESHFPAR